MLPVLYRTPSHEIADARSRDIGWAPPPPQYRATVGDALDVAEPFLADARRVFASVLVATDDRARARAHAANTYHDAVRDWSIAYLNEFPCRAAADFVRDVLRVGIETISRWGR
jgi:hypothetical protein